MSNDDRELTPGEQRWLHRAGLAVDRGIEAITAASLAYGVAEIDSQTDEIADALRGLHNACTAAQETIAEVLRDPYYRCYAAEEMEPWE